MQPVTITIFLALILGMSGCSLNRDLNRGKDKTIASSDTAVEAKGDRPQETGEGLPGYLLDPDLLAFQRSSAAVEIKGSARAIRSADEKTQAQRLWIIAYQQGVHSFRREQNQIVLSGRLVAAILTQDDGSFSSQFPLAADEMLFLRLSDGRADHELAFQPGDSARDRVMLDPASGKFQAFDATSTQTLSYAIDPQGTPSAQLAFLKATRACRGCTLSGANLAGADLNGCVLIGTNLAGSDLSGADLRNCQMQGSNLSGSNLARANLTAADLTQADLTNAILTEAILTNVKGYPAP